MKTRLYPMVGLSVAIAALIGVSCSQQSGSGSVSLISTANAEPAPEVTNSTPVPDASQVPAVAEAPEPETQEIPQTPAVAAPSSEEKKLPANVKQNGPTAEIMKLAQAGVDDAVLLTYITNTHGAFALTSDDIVYLNDLGVANEVITAMMTHDQGASATNWGAQANAQSDVAAAAPQYTNPPQPEAQPQPEPQAAPAPAEPPLTPPQGQDVANNNYFYSSLSPYGTWVDVDGYGRVWQPTVAVANTSWAPYSDRGHWVYTDCGWYWMSDYSWGWAPFHYGRWFRHARFGWCWYPDRVWAPSWVSWRYSNDYCGWAPLPPAAYYRPGLGFSYYGSSVGVGFSFGLGSSCFTFVSWNNFCSPRPWHHRIAHHDVRRVYNNTTIVNNITVNNNKTVINKGVPVDRVRERTHNQLKPVAIRDNIGDPRNGNNNNHRDRVDRDGRLVVNRPNIPERSMPKQALPANPSQRRGDNTPAANAASRAIADDLRRRGDNNSGNAKVVGTQNGPATAPAASPNQPSRGNDRGTVRSNGRDNNNNNGPRRDQSAASQNNNNAPTVVGGSQGNDTRRDNANVSQNNGGTTVIGRSGNNNATPATGSTQPQNNNGKRPPMVVIGRGNDNRGNDNRPSTGTISPPRNGDSREALNTHTWTPNSSTVQQSPSTRQQAPVYTPPATPSSSSRVGNRDSSPSYSAPRQAAPAPVYNAPRQATPGPSYSAPRQAAPAPVYNAPRQASPSPSYNAPRQAAPTPAPSYSAPRQAAPAPAPSYSQPSGGSSGRSSGGDSPRSSGGGNNNNSSNGGGNGRGGRDR